MTDRTPTEDISAGLSANPDAGTERRARRIAADFKPNPVYDRLIVLRDADSPRWADVSRGTRVAVAMYERQRAVAAEHGVDTTPTPPPAA